MAALQTQHYIVDKILTKYTTQNRLALIPFVCQHFKLMTRYTGH